MVIPLVDGMIVSRRALGKVFTCGLFLKYIFMSQNEVEIRKYVTK